METGQFNPNDDAIIKAHYEDMDELARQKDEIIQALTKENEEGLKWVIHWMGKATERAKENEELREIAEEILYWDTCPEKMKEQVRNILTPKN